MNNHPSALYGLDPTRVQARLTTRTFRHLVYLPTTPSTNDAARGLADQGAPEGTVVVADEQSAGRGRLGRPWQAPPGTCLLCSILFRPTFSLPQVPQLTMLCALAAADAIEQVGNLPVALKWPNDLVVQTASQQKKLAGVLTETSVIGERVQFAVVGLGINVNVLPEALLTLAANATSILAETGHAVQRAALLAALLAGVEARSERLRDGQSPHDEWAARLITLGQQVTATTSEGTLEGLAAGVDAGGALLLRTADGTLHTLLAGDVTLATE